MGVAPTIYTTDSVNLIAVDTASQDLKDRCLDPVLECLYETAVLGAENFFEISGSLRDYLIDCNELEVVIY